MNLARLPLRVPTARTINSGLSTTSRVEPRGIHAMAARRDSHSSRRFPPRAARPLPVEGRNCPRCSAAVPFCHRARRSRAGGSLRPGSSGCI